MKPVREQGVSNQRDWAKFMRKRRDSLMNTKVFPTWLKFQNLGRTTRSPSTYKDSRKIPHPYTDCLFLLEASNILREHHFSFGLSHTQTGQLFSDFSTQIDDFSGPALLYEIWIVTVFSRLLIGGSSGESFFFWIVCITSEFTHWYRNGILLPRIYSTHQKNGSRKCYIVVTQKFSAPYPEALAAHMICFDAFVI